VKIPVCGELVRKALNKYWVYAGNLKDNTEHGGKKRSLELTGDNPLCNSHGNG